MSEVIKSELISRRKIFSFLGLAAVASIAVPDDDDDRNGGRGRRWRSNLSRERCWRKSA